MDLRNLPANLDASGRVAKRRALIEKELHADLSALHISPSQIGHADEQNCEQMFGAVPIPVGLAGPLKVHFSSGEIKEAYVPLATTEGALVASINRGCKAVTASGGVRASSIYIGITRSIAFETKITKEISDKICALDREWKRIAEATSSHLKILSYEISAKRGVLFLTIVADTDEAMGMNMVTIAAQAIGEYISKKLGIPMLTVAANVDSDKKPSARTKMRGRGYRVSVEAEIPEETIKAVLKSDSTTLLRTARAKLEIGSELAGAIGKNLHAANTISAIYLATGQDAAHVVEGSLSDTAVSKTRNGILISVDLPAVLVGVRGGGTSLPAQKQCLDILLKQKTSLRPPAQIAETVGAAVLAGELSLLAAQATNTLAKAHRELSRKR